jgi:hypothetical protein
MILLPDQQILVRKVCDALHEAAASVPSNGNKPPLGWTETICRAVFDRLDKEEEGIECAFGLGACRVVIHTATLIDLSLTMCGALFVSLR